MDHNNILAVVLAGGKSKRFGKDKSQVKLGNKILIDYILTEINNTQISNTSELKSFERADIFQITFVDLNGVKEKLIFD